ncbi:E set domain-containing protein [Suhomyces tanzawaensis NRRL Y-17324]|uniref:E set domain-containing protein n=1 Tax=Suhomyces tanzawaensis NRRL Y-17324 TaxID=984487 RepID=A0A1E4SDB6_9ASCO|nr:E set domain-containing protein [Suhomyces tanzawaensis NRRL Y-17324]ODV77382.1 E set domain-containing protein [Suhomyces tanzawaensis NRRL Y-17324]
MTKTKEEIHAQFDSEFLDLESMIIDIVDHQTQLVYARDMEEMPQQLHFVLPEYSTYVLTVKYKVKKRDLGKLTYHQVVRKHGIPFKTRNEDVTKNAVITECPKSPHSVTFAPDTLPGGPFIRGTYDASSHFEEQGQKLLSVPWKIEIVKKNVKPRIDGYYS